MLLSLPVAAQNNKDHNLDVAKSLDVFNAIYKNLDYMYVDTLNATDVVGTAINSMLESLDPYTSYYPEDKAAEYKEMMTGKYAGVGAVISYNFKIKRVVINEPYEGMPAAEAGLRKGDIILSIDQADQPVGQRPPARRRWHHACAESAAPRDGQEAHDEDYA